MIFLVTDLESRHDFYIRCSSPGYGKPDASSGARGTSPSQTSEKARPSMQSPSPRFRPSSSSTTRRAATAPRVSPWRRALRSRAPTAQRLSSATLSRSRPTPTATTPAAHTTSRPPPPSSAPSCAPPSRCSRAAPARPWWRGRASAAFRPRYPFPVYRE